MHNNNKVEKLRLLKSDQASTKIYYHATNWCELKASLLIRLLNNWITTTNAMKVNND